MQMIKQKMNLRNFLFFIGYFKAVGGRFEDNMVYLVLKIPSIC
jgi:hypothetical protein